MILLKNKKKMNKLYMKKQKFKFNIIIRMNKKLKEN